MTQERMYERKKILVERGIQFRFARFVIFFAVGTAVLTSTIVFYTTASFLGERLADVYPHGRLVAVFRTVYLFFFGIILAITPLIFYMSIRFSHRVIGPLPKIYDVLRKVGEGDFNQSLTLRKNDELKELAAVINEMIQNLRKRTSKR